MVMGNSVGGDIRLINELLLTTLLIMEHYFCEKMDEEPAHINISVSL